MNARRPRTLAPALWALSCAAVAGGSGLSADADSVPWSRLQGRIAYSATPAWASTLAGDGSAGLKVSGLAVMGDLYVGGHRPGHAVPAGFRATGGLLVGSRGGLWASRAASGEGLLVVDRRVVGLAAAPVHALSETAEDTASVPYIGIGYSSLPSRGGWSFTADLGLVSRSPGNAVRFGRVFTGSQNLDDVVRDLRLAPVLQLGVTYAF